MKKVFNLPEKGNSPILFAWQKYQGNYIAIATTGQTDQAVSIFDRHGDLKAEIIVSEPCVNLDWNADGDVLSVITEKSPIIHMWDATNNKKSQIDTGLRDNLSFMKWSKNSSLLAIGTSKGNLLIYNNDTGKKIPILGKHTRRITCGDWSEQNLLALGSDDKTLSVSNAEGDTQRQTTLRDVPSGVYFSEMKTDEKSNSGQNTISCIVGGKGLFLYNLLDPEQPVELNFQQRYGSVVDYRWYGDGYIMIGFSAGYFIAISTHLKEIGQELYQARDHKNNLTGIAYSEQLSRCASAGDSSVKIHDIADFRELTAIINIEDDRSVDKIGWSDDGQLLAVSTPKGALYVFLTKLPMLGASSGTRLAFLTSLLEVTVQDLAYVDPETESSLANPSQTLNIEVEPTFIGLGPDHLVVGMNNRAWFYKAAENGFEALYNHEYLGTVNSIYLNSEYAAAGFDGKIMLHIIDDTYSINKKIDSETAAGMDEQKERMLFPEKGRSNERITDHYLTSDFLIYSTDKGDLNYFFPADWKYVNEFHHVVGIKKIYPNANGTRLIFIDNKGEAFIYNPVNDQLIEVPNFSPTTKTVLWDEADSHNCTIVACDDSKLYTFCYSAHALSLTNSNINDNSYNPGLAHQIAAAAESTTADTPRAKLPSAPPLVSSKHVQCSLVGVTMLPYGHLPLLIYNGIITLLTSSGKLFTTTLGTHAYMQNKKKIHMLSEEELTTNFHQALQTCQFNEAWRYAEKLNKLEAWNQLGKVAIKTLSIDFAVRVYRQIGDAGMVFALNSVKDTEDRNLLSGYMSMFLGDFNVAQDHFLASSYPLAALEMRRDLLHWDAALQLAKALSPGEIPFIGKEYAAQLEFTGDYVNAMMHYEKSITGRSDQADHDEACAAGIARMAIRLGDTKRGVQLAQQSRNKSLMKECAAILEQIKQFSDSAVLYEAGGFLERAVSVYIRLNNWNKVGELLPKVNSPKLHLLYAKAREAEGNYKAAVKAFEFAKDWDSVIRLYLDHLGSPQEAVRIVKETRSVEGAKLVAQFFIKLNDYGSAIQFLVMSKCLDEAFRLAQSHRQMETYAEIIGDNGTPEDYQSIALHFENEKNHHLAGKFFYMAGHYERAMKHLLRVPYQDDSPSLDLAVATVGQANDDKLTNQLIDYLMGETDNVPKDAKYLFRLYMALDQFREASRTAIIIAREEQNGGNYRVAHDLLFSMMQELKQHKIRIPSEMSNSLMMLHSYVVAKLHIKKGDHLKGARLLIRVAQNISKFPSHVVPILTSTVIECHRSGLRNSSFSYAAMLMRPEYRDQVDLKYRKKLETIVRRPDKMEEEETTSPCPFCDNSRLLSYELYCVDCKNTIPYCIITGQHVIKNDFTICPSCNFPAIHSEFLNYLETDPICPMCSETIMIEQVKKISDPTNYLNTELQEE